jgi:thiamine-phosphate pyrophosphorylase
MHAIGNLNVVAQARQILDIPIVGIGGIDFDNQQQAFDAGCSAVAMIATLWD